MTLPENRELHEAFARLGEGAEPREDCPAADSIWAAVEGELDPAETRAVIEHTAVCPACARAWRIAVDVSREAHRCAAAPAEAPGQVAAIVADAGEGAPASSPQRRRRRRWVLPIAALLLVGLGGGFLYHSAQNQNVQRGSGEQAVESLLPQNPSLPRDRFLLEWEGPTDAEFDLTLMTEDLSRVVVRAAGLTESRYRVAPEKLEELAPGTPLLWRVEARRDNGQRAGSPTFRVTLVEP